MSQYIKIHDNRIDSDNYLFQMTIGQYYTLMKDSLFNNEYQRRRVQNSTSIYALLRTDLMRGCVMPPIVLATECEIDDSEDLLKQLKEMKNPPIILDGLQRSLTIRDLYNNSENEIDILKNIPIRIELYSKISRIGLLYRMLTLNTGQTKMSTRHQIEIIYSDYKDCCDIEGIRLITQNEGESPINQGEYNFRDVVDGFTSYIQKDYLLLDRTDILESVKDLERLSLMNSDKDLFKSFIKSYDYFIRHIRDKILTGFEDKVSQLPLDKSPFGNSAINIFNKSQAMTGFGNAVASLVEFKIIKDFEEIESLIKRIDGQSVESGVLDILVHLDKVRKYAKKIGNDQRLYFYHFFRSLFNEERSGLDIKRAAEQAYHNYEREVL